MSRAPGADRGRAADLDHSVEVTDVNAQLQRCRCHQGTKVTGAQTRLDHPPARRRKTPVVGGYLEGRVHVGGRTQGVQGYDQGLWGPKLRLVLPL